MGRKLGSRNLKQDKQRSTHSYTQNKGDKKCGSLDITTQFSGLGKKHFSSALPLSQTKLVCLMV